MIKMSRKLCALRAVALAAATMIGVCGGISAPVSASPVTIVWDVTGTFDDGGTLSGFFTWTEYNALSSAPGSLSLTTTLGTTLGGTTYSLPPSSPSGGAPANGFIITNNYSQVLSLTFENPLTTPGTDPILVGVNSYECFSFGCPPGGADGVDTRYFTVGSAVAVVTPLPAALPLFATGLGALGLFGWRRKRKAAAIAAA